MLPTYTKVKATEFCRELDWADFHRKIESGAVGFRSEINMGKVGSNKYLSIRIFSIFLRPLLIKKLINGKKNISIPASFIQDIPPPFLGKGRLCIIFILNALQFYQKSYKIRIC